MHQVMDHLEVAVEEDTQGKDCPCALGVASLVITAQNVTGLQEQEETSTLR